MAERYVLDKLDRKLIYWLDFNARLSNKELARKLNCSEHVIAYRLNRLLNRGLAKSFGVIINGSRFGLLYFRIYLRFQKIDSQSETSLIQRIVSSHYTTWVASLRGKYDLVFSMYAKNVKHFSQLIHDLLDELDTVILEKNILLPEEIPTYSRAHIIGEKNPKEFVYVSSTDRISMDELDKEIIIALCQNARTSNLQLGQKLNVSPDTIRNRITKLTEKGIILGYRTVFDLRSAGYLSYIVSLYLHRATTDRLKALQGFAQMQPNILFYVKCIGDHDLDLEIEVSLEEELDNLINQLKGSFSDIIKDYEIFPVLKEHKYTFFDLDQKDLQI